VFVFQTGTGADQINDFSSIDRIDIAALDEITSFQDLTASHLTQQGADVLISDGLGNTILVKSVVISAFTADQFIF
jgi:hypothetical protein